MEDCTGDQSTSLFETVAEQGSPHSNNNNNSDFKTETLKDVKFVNTSETRKRTNPESNSLEEGNLSRAMKDNFDWFDGMDNDGDVFSDDLYDQEGLSCHIEPGPCANRYRR